MQRFRLKNELKNDKLSMIAAGVCSLNVVYDEKGKRGFLKLNATALILTFSALMLGIIGDWFGSCAFGMAREFLVGSRRGGFLM